MTKGIFNVVVMFSFVVIVVIGIGTTNAFTQFKVMERQQESTSVVVNITDEMKFKCIQIDAIRGTDQIEDKEQQ
jgi:hypothetical protein